MGGRGASSGISRSGKPYGTEYATVYQSGNIKFVIKNDGANASPMETMTEGRIYVTVDKNTNNLKYIDFYDKSNKRFKQIDLEHFHPVDGKKERPHVHMGYFHNENGDYILSAEDKKIVDKINKIWYNKNNK